MIHLYLEIDLESSLQVFTLMGELLLKEERRKRLRFPDKCLAMDGKSSVTKEELSIARNGRV